MPRQNRVLPTGQIVADAARGTLMGNRGILHDERSRLGRARWRHTHWICCVLSFKDRRRSVMTPHRYTELFFLDEATALAAGHRPCAECRRGAYKAYRAALGAGGAALPAAAIDRMLHAARIDPRTRVQRRWQASADALPDGAMVIVENAPHLVLGDSLLAWSLRGYGAERRRSSGLVTVLTPEPTVHALRNGYRAGLHESADCGTDCQRGAAAIARDSVDRESVSSAGGTAHPHCRQPAQETSRR